MAVSSEQRAREARSRTSVQVLRSRIADRPPAPALSLHPDGFDLIAEVKRRSPSSGALANDDVMPRARAYVLSGAAAVSVLTEPDEFGGTLEDLERVSAALGGGDDSLSGAVPTLRKDFLTDPYQVFEAGAAGAGGVLVILRIVDDARLEELLVAAAEAGLFVLLEAFDAGDLDRSGSAAEHARALGVHALVGLNSRDLESLTVDRERLRRLADRFPPDVPRVAESGLLDPTDAARASAWGYELGLVGTALMRQKDPSAAVAAMIAAGRAARELARIGEYGGKGLDSEVKHVSRV
jgi:indole-3-glycerol phosphate synthase